MKGYDKILFVLAVLVLGVSVQSYNIFSEDTQQLKKNAEVALKMAPQGEPWQDIKVKEIKLDTKKWAEAQAQSDDRMWLYQLFTPPKIWVDSDGKFVVQPPNSEKKLEQTFGYKFGALKHDPYPIKYRGYFVVNRDGKQENVIQLFDEKNNYSMRGRVNEEIMVTEARTGKTINTGITVKSFDKKTTRDKEKTIYVTTEIVVLNDKSLGREITIFSDKPTYIEESKALILSSDGATGGDWEVKAVGNTRKTEEAVYTVKELDIEAGFAVVEKVSVKGDLPPQKMRISKDGNKLLKE